MDRLTAFAALILKWNQRINLIGRSTEAALWTRHIADSAQLWALRPGHVRRWADLGSGAGLPGLVVAALANEGTPVRVTLVESDLRKCAFLAEAARVMQLDVTILAQRIEALDALGADVLSARALAPLPALLGYTEKHRSRDGMGLFPKGETVHKEIENAARTWRFEHRVHRSVTDPRAAILEIGAVSRA